MKVLIDEEEILGTVYRYFHAFHQDREFFLQVSDKGEAKIQIEENTFEDWRNTQEEFLNQGVQSTILFKDFNLKATK